MARQNNSAVRPAVTAHTDNLVDGERWIDGWMGLKRNQSEVAGHTSAMCPYTTDYKSGELLGGGNELNCRHPLVSLPRSCAGYVQFPRIKSQLGTLSTTDVHG